MEEHSGQREQPMHDLQGGAVCLRPICLGKARVAGGRVAMSLMRDEDSSLAFHLRERH